MACCGAAALATVDLGVASALLEEEVTSNPTIELPELTQDWGKEILVCTRTQERGVG